MRSRLLALPGLVALLLAAGATSASASQTAGQAAINSQSATSVASSVQSDPSNIASPIRILSPGSNGSISQSNNSSATSSATNHNHTTQTVEQTSSGGAGLGAIQAGGQAAISSQTALSGAASSQQSPTNVAAPIRILSPGDNGSVRQSNNSSATSSATNHNTTHQRTVQSDPSGGGGSTQAAGQLSGNHQEAGSVAESTQSHATNAAVPIRILSPGDNGSVSQSNNSSATSSATNNNETRQSITQDPVGALLSDPIQAAGQLAQNRQGAVSAAVSHQIRPKNLAAPIRILSPGDNGSVSQSNNSSATSSATNNNETRQTLTSALDGLLVLI